MAKKKEQRSWFEMKAGEDKTAEIFIYGSIGKSWYDDDAVSAKSFVDELKGLGAVEEITLRINSPGGVVYDGLAIHNALKAHKAKVICIVDGLAASMAAFIAMSADTIKMPKNSFMLIHKASGGAWGNSDDIEKMVKDLKRIDKVAAQAFSARSGQSREDVDALMSEDRLMDADEAVELGYADEIVDEVEIAADYDRRAFSLLPEHAREQFEHSLSSESPPSEEEDDEEEDEEETQETSSSEKEKPAGKKKGGAVVSLDAARGDGDKRARQYAAEITDLCSLAGAPASMASDFIKRRAPLASVRRDLLKFKADSSGEEIDGHHANTTGLQPRRSQAEASKQAASWEKAINAVNARAPSGAR